MVTTNAFALAKDEVNALVYPIEDWQGLAQGINRVMNNKELFLNLRTNAIALAQEYNLNKSQEQFEKVINSFS